MKTSKTPVVRAAPRAAVLAILCGLLAVPAFAADNTVSLRLKDHAFTPAQVAGLKAISDSLELKLGVRRDSLKQVLARTDLSALRRQATTQRAAPSPFGSDFGDRPGMTGNAIAMRNAMQKLQQAMAPALDSARADVGRSLAAARQLLQPQQWDRLPFALRAPTVGGGGGGRGFNGVGMLDRMLANPIPVLLELKDTLGLTPEQVTRIQAISARLGAKLAKQREALGKRFDNTNSADQARLFTEIQPAIQATRQDVADAMQDVRKVLTQQQWLKLPAEVVNPFARRAGGRPGS